MVQRTDWAKDIKSPTLLYVKGFLFLVGGLLSSAVLLLDDPTLRTALLLTVAVWCFARAYYFAFYVIGHYVDSGYHIVSMPTLDELKQSDSERA